MFNCTYKIARHFTSSKVEVTPPGGGANANHSLRSGWLTSLAWQFCLQSHIINQAIES